MVKVDYELRRYIVYETLELARKNILNDAEKRKIIKVVNNLKERTEMQKYRFGLFYNLYNNDTIIYTISDIARMDGVRFSAVKQSIVRVRSALVNTNDKDLIILFRILKKYK